MVAKDDLLQYGFKMISVAQENPYRVRLHTKMLRTANLMMALLLAVMTVVNFTKVRGKKFCRSGESLATEFQITTKYLTIIIFHSEFIRLYNCRDAYWNIEEADPETAMRLKKYYKYMRVFLKVLIFLSLSTVTSFFAKPLILYKQNDIMVIEGWIPNVYFLTSRNLLIVQYWVLCYGVFVVIGFDCIFAALAFHLYAQVVYLNSELRCLYMEFDGDLWTDRRAKEKLNECIRYHKFLLEVFKLMGHVYSFHFLCQYFSTMVTACMDFYLLADSTTNFDVVEVIKTVFYLCTLLFEFGFFCFPAEYLKHEILNITDSIYESKWYESKLKYQRDLLFVMLKAQRAPEFRAGGFTVIDVNAYMSVFKAAFSFYTIMKNVFDK